MAMKPRMAPTTMKTVPSGRLLVCMYGALAVGGTDGATITNAPDNVGRPVKAPPPAAAEPPVIDGTEMADPVEPDPVITIFGADDEPAAVVPDPLVGVVSVLWPEETGEAVEGAEAGEAVFDVVPSVACVAVERLGSFDDCAFEPIARRETAIAEASSGVLRRSLIVKREIDCVDPVCRSRVRIDPSRDGLSTLSSESNRSNGMGGVWIMMPISNIC